MQAQPSDGGVQGLRGLGQLVRTRPANVVPLDLRYMNHLTMQTHDWPRRADGRLLSCSDVKADLQLNCDYLVRAHRLGLLWISQTVLRHQRLQPVPMHQPRVLYAAPSNADAAPACMHVTAAERVRVRSTEVAHLAVMLVTNCDSPPTARVRKQWSGSVFTRVFSGHWQAVQVIIVPCVTCCGG